MPTLSVDIPFFLCVIFDQGPPWEGVQVLLWLIGACFSPVSKVWGEEWTFLLGRKRARYEHLPQGLRAGTHRGGRMKILTPKHETVLDKNQATRLLPASLNCRL